VIDKGSDSLKRLGAPAASLLAESLRDSSEVIRGYALEKFALSFDSCPSSATPALVELVLDKDGETANLAVCALSKVKNQQTVRAIVLKEEAKADKFVIALAAMVEPDEKSYVRWGYTESVRLLADLGPRARLAVPALLARVEKRSCSIEDRVLAAAALGAIRARSAVALLQTLAVAPTKTTPDQPGWVLLNPAWEKTTVTQARTKELWREG
jgi:HEAT repeat protein